MGKEQKAITLKPNDRAEQSWSDVNSSEAEDFVIANGVDQPAVEHDGADDDAICMDLPSSIRSKTFMNRFGSHAAPNNAIRPPNERRATNLWYSASRCFSRQKETKFSRVDQVRISPHEELGWQGLAHVSGEAFSSATNWLQRRTFIAVVGLFLIFYLIFITLFCFILYAGINFSYSEKGMMCCEGFDFDANTVSNNYQVVFELSWTTFATVGYGDIAVPADQECQGIRYVLAIEAFLGILFTSVCGAIFYSKIVRLHTQAHVTFSSAICLHYGNGVTDAVFEVNRSDRPNENVSHTDKEAVTHYPIIEMRCLNDRAIAGGGEIIGARLKCIVTSLEDVTDSQQGDGRGVDLLRGSLTTDGSHNVVKRLITSNLSLAPDTHPYFSSGIWFIRHVLDHRSPLVSPSVAERIAEAGGWPADLDSPAKIRGCLNQNVREIVITFTGTSNLTADRVFLNQTYTLSDIYIGWKFASMVYVVDGGPRRKPRAELDLKLVHDITPVLDEEHEALDTTGLSRGLTY